MFLEILKHTPYWVFALFVVLLALGYVQSRPRYMSRPRLLVIPAIMFALSFYGVISGFGGAFIAVAAWVVGVVLLQLLPVRVKGARFAPETRQFSVPGSWVPLALIMSIFCIKYAVGVALARQLPVVTHTNFIVSVSLIYGLVSGAFLARARAVLRAAHEAPQGAPAAA